MPLIVGLTGGIGSGKTTVADEFSRLGIQLADADIAAREVVEPGQPALDAIFQRFGDALRQPDGALDRAALRRIVFADSEQRRWLESLLHPLIRERLTQQLAAATSPYALLVSPLLLETDQHQLADQILIIDLPESLQLERTMSRDRNDAAQVRAIIASQIARTDRLARADQILDNSAPVDTLAARVAELDQYYRQLAKARTY
ncbi:dephospho-CoA kinase [Motiliproteus sediminis]|uniref:dephospho-CoA kinase n=1 Tax=Motiliproteus sediminis TaxID=1468178 RepID=UPI001AEFEF5B|nr:dephospho-CoA kinase [Motiliproteus sediminis]